MTAKPGKCPICGKNAGEKTRPFCSPRCAMLDLGQWLGDGYAIPVDPESDAFESVPASENDEEMG